MKPAGDEFFALIGEGAALLKNLDENSPGFFDDLNRLREILAMLGDVAPDVSAPVGLAFSLADREASAKALYDYMGIGLKTLPAELAVFEAHTVGDLAQLIGNNTVAEAASEAIYANKYDPRSAEAKLAAFATLAGRGVKHGIEQAELDRAVKDADELLAKRLDDDPEYAPARARYDQLSRDGQAQLRELNAKVRDAASSYRDAVRDQRGADEIAALQASRAALEAELERFYHDIRQQQSEAWELVKQTHAKFIEDRANGQRAVFEAHGQAILAKIAEASPITDEQAQAWAAEQVIDDNARAKLKKLGYKPEDVVRDMAEFYRLTGGKASAIRIGLDGGRRANAVGITERLGEKVINLGSSFNKTVLFHELAHHLENDPIAKAASNGFLLKRREGEGVYRLRDLTGNKGYDAREIAYKDHFMDAYVGKVYRDGITEVWSMGVQYLANPKDAAIFAAKDPEMFALITGYLSAPLTPAMSAKLNMHKGAVSDAMERRQNEEELYERAVAYFAAQAPLVKNDWFEKLDKTDGYYRDFDWYVLSQCKKGQSEYVGAFGDYRVFSGMVRNPATKRNAKGYIVAHIWNLSQAVVMTGGPDIAQAMIAVTEKNGTGLRDARYGYFLDGFSKDRKKKLIELAGMENLQ